jgi:hypothetical protein
MFVNREIMERGNALMTPRSKLMDSSKAFFPY